jgi:hypothetical protein
LISHFDHLLPAKNAKTTTTLRPLLASALHITLEWAKLQHHAKCGERVRECRRAPKRRAEASARRHSKAPRRCSSADSRRRARGSPLRCELPQSASRRPDDRWDGAKVCTAIGSRYRLGSPRIGAALLYIEGNETSYLDRSPPIRSRALPDNEYHPRSAAGSPTSTDPNDRATT